MREELKTYYVRELDYLRQLGAEFGRQHQKIAGRLQLEDTKCEDPHVERLLEGFAFLAARVHLRIDDDFPEISQALLGVLYPQYIRPVPSMSVAQFHLDPELGKVTTGYPIAKDTPLHTRPVDGNTCQFRTCYDTTLWPVEVVDGRWTAASRGASGLRSEGAEAVARLELQCLADVQFRTLGLKTLRFHISGENELAFALYELLDKHCQRIVIRDLATQRTVELSGSALQPVGFGPDEALLPDVTRAFAGHRLLQEYFTFPKKFLFFDLSGFDRVRDAEMGDRIEILFFISQFDRTDWRAFLPSAFNASTLRLGCTPVVNLFRQVAEPISLTQRRHEHPLIPDVHHRQTTMVYSVDKVVGTIPGSRDDVVFEPLYAPGLDAARAADQMYWAAAQRISNWRPDAGTDLFMSFVDLGGQPSMARDIDVTSILTCCNGNLPSRLPFGGEESDFSLEGSGPVARVSSLTKPTPMLPPPSGRLLSWRLLSQLSVNYLSLTADGAAPLRELLRLHDFVDSPVTRQHIEGVAEVTSTPAYSRVTTQLGVSFARGLRIDLSLDEGMFTGASAYLFAAVLDQFFGLYCSMNSFSMLSARTLTRKALLGEWPARAGWRPLL